MTAFPWATFIRALLKFGGGYFVQRGITDESTMEIIVAGLAALLGVAWSCIARARLRRKLKSLQEACEPEI